MEHMRRRRGCQEEAEEKRENTKREDDLHTWHRIERGGQSKLVTKSTSGIWIEAKEPLQSWTFGRHQSLFWLLLWTVSLIATLTNQRGERERETLVVSSLDHANGKLLTGEARFYSTVRVIYFYGWYTFLGLLVSFLSLTQFLLTNFPSLSMLLSCWLPLLFLSYSCLQVWRRKQLSETSDLHTSHLRTKGENCSGKVVSKRKSKREAAKKNTSRRRGGDESKWVDATPPFLSHLLAYITFLFLLIRVNKLTQWLDLNDSLSLSLWCEMCAMSAMWPSLFPNVV